MTTANTETPTEKAPAFDMKTYSKENERKYYRQGIYTELEGDTIDPRERVRRLIRSLSQLSAMMFVLGNMDFSEVAGDEAELEAVKDFANLAYKELARAFSEAAELENAFEDRKP